jgi:DNA repair exonuclease SbcCD nuclease subunit
MKIAIINDTHFGIRSDSIAFHEYFKHFYENEFFPYLEKNNITHIIHQGDIVDRRKFINYLSLDIFNKVFVVPCIEKNITVDLIIGNHDTYYKNTNETNCANLLIFHENFEVYTKPHLKQYDGVDVGLIPWICPENLDESVEFLKTTKAQILFGHLEISGFSMYKGLVSHEGLNKSIFDRFDMVCSGHFHHKSDDGTIYYLGAPMEYNWNDCNDDRGFHIFDTDTRKLKYIKTKFKMFYKIFYDDKTNDYSNIDVSIYNSKMVKLYVVNKTNLKMFSDLVDRIERENPIEFNVVEDLAEFHEEEEGEVETENTLDFLLGYIDNMELLKEEKSKLSKYMQELYIEAISE